MNKIIYLNFLNAMGYCLVQLLGLPYQGIMNQINCLFRAMVICRSLNLSLIIPPIFHSNEESVPVYFPFSNYFRLPNIPIENKEELRNIKKFSKSPLLLLHGRWKDQIMLGATSRAVLKDFFKNNLAIKNLNIDKNNNFNEIITALLNINIENNTILFSNLQHINLWKEGSKFLTKVCFNNFSKKIFKSYKNEILKENKYTCIHWRRGDFENACKKNKNYTECFPKTEEIFKRAKYTTVLIATNEKDINFLNEISENFTLISKFHTNDPILNFLTDIYFMINSDQFIGNKYSSISRNVLIIREILNKTSEFF
jgi:hypothetical protein